AAAPSISGPVGQAPLVSPDSGNAGRPGAGASSAPTFFRIAARGRTVVYVIDRSASMGLRGAFHAACQELAGSLAALSPEVMFQVVAYNRTVEVFQADGATGLVPATSENKRRAAAWLTSLRAEGGTDHAAALRRALALRPDAVFFLSDAGDLTEQQVKG